MTSGKGAKKPSDKSMEKIAGPWMPMQNDLKAAISDAKKVSSPYQYGPDRVAALDPATQWGINQGSNIAMSGQGSDLLAGAYNNVGNLAAGNLSGAGSGYLNQIASQGFGQGAGTAYMDKIATQGGGRGAGAAYMDKIAKQGIANPAFKDLQSVLADANQGAGISDRLERIDKYAAKGSGGIQYLQDVVGGKFIDKNPYIDKLVSDVETDAKNTLLPALEGRMSQAGRMGSNAETMGQGEIARKLAQTSNDIRYTDYSNERGMQQQAGLALPGAYGQEINNRLGALGAISDEHYNNLQSRLGAAQAVGSDVYAREGIQMDAASRADADHQAAVAQQLGAAGMANDNLRANVGLRANIAGQANADQLNFNNQSLQAASQLPGQYQSLYAPADNAMRYGAVQHAQDQARTSEAADKFQYQQNMPAEQLQRRLGLFGQINGMTNPAAAGAAYTQGMNGPSATQVAIGNVIGLTGAATGAAGAFQNQYQPTPQPAAPQQQQPMMGSYTPPGYNPYMRY